ncbi:hypothetical protein BDN70DRAFT_906131 [Pholiota conissans]|uniref:F-box domain-containing protein n=1 Tax=Pholiota conissans TaxID=109636 RepID=A0A9P5Z3W6_9AGAR|nr:hypothetical protein BDN70DRAFT_906131 [Pholiota conissans]
MRRSHLFPIVFETLPVEIICHILDNLEMHDLLTCTTYIIELEKARMVSLVPRSEPLPFASRLKLLRERERNWKHLNWTKRHKLDLPPTGSVYEFVGGLYGNGREDDSRVTASISFLELPSTDATFLGEPQKELNTWTHSMGDVNIIDFTMDPSQDLLVLVALAPPDSKYVYQLHLRSIQSNMPHHKAPVPMLPCWLKPTTPMQSSDLVAGVRVQVAGNIVALLIKEIQEGPAAHLEIWNWQTNPQYSCAMTRQSGIDDFTFLTHDTFLVVRPIGRFEVYTFEDPSEGSMKPRLRVTYAFPPLSHGYMYWYISMSSNPAPGYVPRHPTSGPELGNKRQLYYPRPEERIHACCLYIFNPASEENAHVYSFVFFLNLQSLLNPHTEWIEKTQAMNASKIAASKRSQNGDLNSSPSASSSINLEIPILPPGFFDTDTTPPFIPPYTAQGEIRFPPTYPLFPTFDAQYPGIIPPRQASRSHPAKQQPECKPPPSRPTRRARPATSTLDELPAKLEIPWEVWGPQSTRWFEECLSTDWQHAIYGLRTVDSINPQHSRQNVPAAVNTGASAPLPKPVTPEDTSTSTAASTLTNGANENAVASSSSLGPSTAGPSAAQPSQSTSTLTQPQIPSENGEEVQGDEQVEEPDGHDINYGDGGDAGSAHPRRFLRVRDFNPYSFTEDSAALIPPRAANPKSRSRGQTQWRQPRLVTEASTTPVKGVFKKDIVSSLPYMEILSREAFEVTDVMMDDCRLLLLKRGQAGKLKRVEVLML